MRIVIIHTNCPDAESARHIADVLIAERLAACSNLFAEIESAFHWKGAVEHEAERPLLLKTRAELFEQAADRIRQLHPYETPEIVGVVPEYVSQHYADWIRAETVEPDSASPGAS